MFTYSFTYSLEGLRGRLKCLCAITTRTPGWNAPIEENVIGILGKSNIFVYCLTYLWLLMFQNCLFASALHAWNFFFKKRIIDLLFDLLCLFVCLLIMCLFIIFCCLFLFLLLVYIFRECLCWAPFEGMACQRNRCFNVSELRANVSSFSTSLLNILILSIFLSHTFNCPTHFFRIWYWYIIV